MSKIQFIHRRPINLIHSMYTPASHGGFTVAYQEVEPGLIEYSIAQCSNRDNFNKKLGRDIAHGRLVNNKVAVAQGVTLSEFRDMMYSEPV